MAAALAAVMDNVRPLPRRYLEGTFLHLYLGDQTLCVRGVAYGTVHPTAEGAAYQDPERVERDIAQMAANGLNAYLARPQNLAYLAHPQNLVYLAHPQNFAGERPLVLTESAGWTAAAMAPMPRRGRAPVSCAPRLPRQSQGAKCDLAPAIRPQSAWFAMRPQSQAWR